jgi:hypothetical protein
MPWKKLLAWVTGQIDNSLRQQLEFVLEENRVYRALLDRTFPALAAAGYGAKDIGRKGPTLGEAAGHYNC